MDIDRPASMTRAHKCEKTRIMRFNLLAVAEDQVCKPFDQLEPLKRTGRAGKMVDVAYPKGWGSEVNRFSLTPVNDRCLCVPFGT
jgi:hypothetical protein